MAEINETTLIPVKTLDVAVIFSDTGMDEILDEIEKRALAHVPNLETDQGRKDIASMAYKVARSKGVIDELGKGVIADWKKKTDNINGYRKRARDFLDPLRDRVRQPLTDYEDEQGRIRAEDERLEKVKIQGRVNDLLEVDVSLDYFTVATMSDEDFNAFYTTARTHFEAEQSRIAAEEKAEEEAKEAALIASEKEDERLAEVAKAQKAEADRLEAVRKEQEAKAAELRAAQDKIDADKRDQEKIEAENAARIKATEKARAEMLAEVNFVYPFGDLGAMTDRQWSKMYGEHKKAWDISTHNKWIEEMEAKKVEDAKKEAVRAAEAERLEKAEAERAEKLKPDTEKLLLFANFLQEIQYPELVSGEAKAIKTNAAKQIYDIGEEILQAIERL